MGRKMVFISALILLGVFLFQNKNIVIQTFFPDEKLVAQISLGGERDDKERPSSFSETKKESEAKICSVNYVAGKELSSYRSVMINEVAWMGTRESFSNEWIELKNFSEEKIDISDWQLLDKDLQIKIVFSLKEINPGELILLERGKGFTGNLRNSDEKIFLFDKNCSLIDEAVADPDWPAGDNKKKFTMERFAEDLSWYTSSVSGGTPGYENSKREDATFVKKEETSSEVKSSEDSEDDGVEVIIPGKISINTAGYEKLQEITGVGPVIARRIIEYREAGGLFKQVEEIKNVKGIGEATFLKMKGEISL